MDIIAAAEIAAERSRERDIHLLWVGLGELEAELRENSEVLGKGGRVRSSFPGFLNQSEISKAYSASDCLILPSGPDETWGLVVNEAMASGLPAIISDACGCADDLKLVNHEELIYPSGDVDALAKAMVSVMERPPDRDAIFKKIADFDFTKTVDAIEAQYASIIARSVD